ncbi:MAG: alpha-galactosidase [Thermoproteota archaeon]
MKPLDCNLSVKGRTRFPRELGVEEVGGYGNALLLEWNFPDIEVKLLQTIKSDLQGIIHLRNSLKNNSQNPLILNEVSLIHLGKPGLTSFGIHSKKSRTYEDGGYWGRVRPLSNGSEEVTETSQMVWEVYNPSDGMAFLTGFTTFERWLGTFKILYRGDIGIAKWVAGFDGGDLLIDPGQELVLEDLVLMLDSDPWLLLENFGDLVKEKHNIVPLARPPVSWCSWYPYRLGVTEEHVLKNAKVAAQRLKSLGLRNFQVDLGWEKNHLPSAYDENEQFPHGLKWLAEQLGLLGFNLGVWKAPFTISEFDDVFLDHKEWLLGSYERKPASYWKWFWRPYGDVYALDLTNSEAQEYLRRKMESLVLKGIKYFKFDFIGAPCNPNLRNRYNPRIVSGGGVEATRLGCKIIVDTIKKVEPNSILLGCNPYEPCSIGNFELLYTCNDTGNTGYIPWSIMRDNYTSVAAHLWKNHRLGIIQPSCLCIGPPGTIEEARIRATATFLSGGEVDIGDDLTVLPEDRWQILLSILPPPIQSAKPVDLFEPVIVEQLPYEDMCRGIEMSSKKLEYKGASVWVLQIDAVWDSWILMGLFAWEPPIEKSGGQEHQITRFTIPWRRLGLNPNKKYWAYEFWSGQFLG